MQFKYDPVDGHCYFLRIQITFNILEITPGSQSDCTYNLSLQDMWFAKKLQIYVVREKKNNFIF